MALAFGVRPLRMSWLIVGTLGFVTSRRTAGDGSRSRRPARNGITNRLREPGEHPRSTATVRNSHFSVVLPRGATLESCEDFSGVSSGPGLLPGVRGIVAASKQPPPHASGMDGAPCRDRRDAAHRRTRRAAWNTSRRRRRATATCTRTAAAGATGATTSSTADLHPHRFAREHRPRHRQRRMARARSASARGRAGVVHLLPIHADVPNRVSRRHGTAKLVREIVAMTESWNTTTPVVHASGSETCRTPMAAASICTPHMKTAWTSTFACPVRTATKASEPIELRPRQDPVAGRLPGWPGCGVRLLRTEPQGPRTGST